MNWNPFNKLIAPKKVSVKQTADDEFEKEMCQFSTIESSSKKLWKDAKRLTESHNSELKASQRLSQDLLSTLIGSSGQSHARTEDVVDNLEKLKRLSFSAEVKQLELVAILQHSLFEPMKEFNAVFPNVHQAVKRREQSLFELSKYQTKKERLQEKDLTPQLTAKYDANEKYLAFAKSDFERRNKNLTQDLIRLNGIRIEYFRPCFEALIKAQYTYFEKTLELYDEFLDHNRTGELANVDGGIDDTLAAIKSLSIVSS